MPITQTVSARNIVNKRLQDWPWLTLQIIAANVLIILALGSAWYLVFMQQSSIYSERLMTTFNIEPGSLHSMYVDDVERQLWFSVLLGLVFATVASVGLAFLIATPLRAVARATERLRYGDYQVRSSVSSGEVGLLAQNFNALAATLEQEERRRAQFMADLGHELRTPITSLRGYTEGLEDGVFQPNEGYFRLMAGEINHLTALTHTIENMQLDSAVASDEHQGFSTATIASVLEDAQQRWQCRFQQRHLILDLTIPDNLSRYEIRMPNHYVKQIIDNLLSNMHRYATPDSQCKIDVSVINRTHQIFLAFSNETQDVQQENIPFLFDRLYRVTASRTRLDGEHPTGLGLSVVKQLCIANDGAVTASLSGKKLTFKVMLPIQ